jgi:chromosome segregation ATPase
MPNDPRSRFSRKIVCTAAGAAAVLLTSCSSWYYDALEAVGTSKRDLFRSRVVAARDAQVDAKEQFSSALERFQALRAFDGGKLEETYDNLNDEYEESKERAAQVKKRIDAVESVSEALFDEWEDEIDEYKNASLKSSSEKKRREARRSYERLMESMRRAEARLEPALAPMRDQVLFLKHNLNAKAVASLEGELREVEVDVSSLIASLDSSIAEADRFIETLKE